MEVGMHEAKTRLSELITLLNQGERITLTNRGKEVAEIVLPVSKRKSSAKASMARLRKLAKEHPLGTYEEVMAWRREGLR